MSRDIGKRDGLVVDRVSYHRNGSCGESFAVAEFRVRLGERRKIRLLAIQLSLTDVAVIDPERPHHRFDGKMFNKAIQEAIRVAMLKDWNKPGSAFARKAGERGDGE